MSFALSPGVLVVEKDFTGIIPAVSTTPGAYVGAFEWGPVLDVVLLGSQDDLVKHFGFPNIDTFMDFWTAANFLSYGNNLQVVRVVGTGALNATADGSGHLIKNPTDYSVSAQDGQLDIGPWAAKWPGAKGNSLEVTVIDACADLNTYNGANYFGTNKWSQLFTRPGTSQWVTDRTGLTTADDEMHIVVIDSAGLWTGTIGAILETFPFVSKASDAKSIDGTSSYYKNVMNAQSEYIWWTDQLDTTSGVASVTIGSGGGTGYHQSTTTVTFADPPSGVTATGTVTVMSGAVTAINITNPGSGYLTAPMVTVTDTDLSPGSGGTFTAVLDNVQPTNHNVDIGSSSTALSSTALFKLIHRSGTTKGAESLLSGGTSTEGSVVDANRELGWDMFSNADLYDISLIPTGPASTTLAEYVIQNVAEHRKDCVAFLSPLLTDVHNNFGQEASDIVDTRNMINSSSYAVMDSGWKYQYDKYNDAFRWVPLNGDIAGLCARTDLTNDPWWSPAGFNRGGILNVVKLAYSPDKTDRDVLYINNVNPVVTFPGNGTVLFGDKTLQAKPSAFDRINVRRLFIVLEKAIALAAKYQLFEFNDAFTQAMFRNMVEPFLRDVQGRRGITDFLVICDSTNNTPEIVDTNQFVADIFIKPARSINFIQLNFIATATGVSFSEFGTQTIA
jgi:hypothetical protein